MTKLELDGEEVYERLAECREVVNEFVTPGMVLAGGALRDAICGKEVNDYDIFVDSDAIDRCPVDVRGWLLCHLKEAEQYPLSYVASQLTSKRDGRFLNFVLLKQGFYADRIHEQFNVGISQIAMDSQYEVTWTDGFESDYHYDKLTFSDNVSPLYRLKMLRKFEKEDERNVFNL